MNLSRRQKIGTLAALLATVLLGAAYAATIMQQREVTTNVFVQGSWDFQVYEDGMCTIIWTTYDWGTVNRGIPVQTDELYGKNTGEDSLYVKWNSSLPLGFSLTCKNGTSANSPSTDWPQNTYIGSFSANPPSYSFRYIFELTAGLDSESGTHNIYITFYGSTDGTD